MRKWKGVVLHCSASPWGNAIVIDEWHRKRGFREIGYHFVITNGRPWRDFDGFDDLNGFDVGIETGRDINEVGAHALGYNRTHLGVCLVGPPFTPSQLISMAIHIQDLTRMGIFEDDICDLIGHYETYKGPPEKNCPLLDMELVREFVKGEETHQNVLEKSKAKYGWKDREVE